jgi:hypothetical protein
MGTRRARSRPEFAEWYPDIPAEVWHNAMWVAELVRRQLRRGSPTWSAGERVLDNRHFDFESGDYGALIGTDRRTPVSLADPRT